MPNPSRLAPAFLFLTFSLPLLSAEIETRIYDTSEIVTQLRDYPGPTFSMVLSTSPGDWAAPQAPFGALAVITTPPNSALIQMIKSYISPEKWDPADNVIIEERANMLWITQTPEMHARIASFLATAFITSRTQIAVKSMLLAVENEPQENILTHAAFAKMLHDLGSSRIIAAPRVICSQNHRAHVKAGREFSYVADMEISGDSHDPVVRNLLEGILLDVQPILAASGESVTLDLKFALNAKVDLTEKRTITFDPQVPSRDAAKEKQAPAIPDVEIDTPSIRQFVVKNQVRVPSGKWILAGTMPNPDTAAKEKILALYVSTETLAVDPQANPAVAAGPGIPFGFRHAVIKENAAIADVLKFHDVSDIGTAHPDHLSGYLENVWRYQDPPPSVAFSLQDVDFSTLIKERLLVKEFEDTEHFIEACYGKLLVRHTPAVHDVITKLLSALRKTFAPQIAIKTRILSVRDLPTETLYDAAQLDTLSRAEGTTVLSSPRLTCLNKQRNTTSSGRAITYVRDLDVSGAAYDPIIRTLFDGTTLEARPIVAFNGTGIWLDLQLGITSDSAKTKRPFGAPASTRANATNNAIAQPSHYEIDTIAFNTSGFQTNLFVPKGKWLLAAAWKSHDPKSPTHTALFITAEIIEE